ncbi:MAG: hypothetical protein KBA26_05350 [Candidatus Delongbacteria bacterium]|nr:hypothetical protein [Candidatus Delongbacteria bacterium]
MTAGWFVLGLCGCSTIQAAIPMRVDHVLSQTRQEVVFSVLAEAARTDDTLHFQVCDSIRNMETQVLPPCRACRSRLWQMQVRWHPQAEIDSTVRMRFSVTDSQGHSDTLWVRAHLSDRVKLDTGITP